MVRLAIIGAAALLLAPATVARETAMHHATGTFEVTTTPEAQAPATGGAMPTSRMAIRKTFSGGLAGSAVGTMLAAGTPRPGEPAAYVAIDQFQGSVEGRAGGFLLLHRGTMTRTGNSDLTVVVAPDSGTGALAGIAGTLSIAVKDGRHLYDFAYSLPSRP